MSLRTRLAHGLRFLFRRADADQDSADEVEDYLAHATDAYRHQGLSEADARRAAQVELGSRTAVRQQVRSGRWETRVESLLVDVRRAARRLRRSPGFSTVAVITLALGIGASTAIFSTVRPTLLMALPYPGGARLVVISDGGGPPGTPLDVTFGTYRELLARSRSIERAAVVRAWQPTLAGDGDAERLDGQSVSADYFHVLGVAPALGRTFAAADDAPGAPAVAIISDALWRRRFGARPDLVGRAVTLDGAAVTVAGVMPPAFENVWSPEAGIWRPLGYDPSLPSGGREWGHHLQLIARLNPDVTVSAAARELATIARTPTAAFTRPAWASLDAGFLVESLQDRITGRAAPALRAVTVATLLLLLIAAVNVVNLMLARGAERRLEMVTSAALGASRGRLLTPLLAEGLLLALIGGALGIALAYAMVGALVTLDGFALPRLAAIEVDRAALAFATALSGCVGVAAGCVPAFAFSSRRASPPSSPRVIATGQRLRRAFVVVEVALAMVLLVGAGLLVRTVQRLLTVPSGLRPEGVLTLQVQTSGPQFRDGDTVRQYFDRVLSAVEAVPGVASAALSSQLPLSGDSDTYGVGTENDQLPPGADPSAYRYAVSPGYLRTLGIALQRGRDLDARDSTGAQRVALISASAAQRRFGRRDPIGQRIRIGPPNPTYTVVGVVDNVKQSSLADASRDAVYVPAAQWQFADSAMWVVVKTAVVGSASEAAVRSAIRAVDRNQPIVRVATMEQRVAASMGRERFAMAAFDAFAAIALLLATIGIYGVLAGGVVERTREIALRSAIGASRAQIIGQVARQALIVVTLGIAIGGSAAVALSRGLTTLLFEVSPIDVLTYLGVAVLLVVAASIGAVVPARRAARIVPATALQSH
jgi:putative ABC transport system permease protein